MKKLIISSFAFIAILSSCTKEMIEDSKDNKSGNMVTVTLNATVTKTTLNDDRSVSFTAGEKIAVFVNGNKYMFTTEAGGSSAVFTGEVDADDVTAAAGTYYAISGSTTCLDCVTIDGGVFKNVVLPKSSDWVKTRNYSDTKLVAVAVSSGSSLLFKQVCALLKFTVPADVTDLNEVVVFNRETDNLTRCLSGTCSITPNAGSAPTVEVTVSEGNPHQSGATYTGNKSESKTYFPEGTYYIPVLPATLSRIDIKNTFSGGDIKRVLLNVNTTLVSGQVYNLGTIRKANKFMCSTFDNNNLNGDYTGNTGAIKIVSNPLPSSTVNNSPYVLADDMQTAGTTSGYWQTGSNFATKFTSSCRGSFTTVKMKMFWGSDKYYPRFLYNKGGTAMLPARVNGVDIEPNDVTSFDGAYKEGDWNILEWDCSQFSSKTSFSDLSSFQVKMFLDWGGSNTTRDGVNYHHIAYIDEIEFL